MEKEGGGKASSGIPGGVIHDRHWGQGSFWEGVLGRKFGEKLQEGVRCFEQDFFGGKMLWEGASGSFGKVLGEGFGGR